MEFLNRINTLLTDILGPFGPLIAIGILGVVLIGLTLPALLKKDVDPLDRIKEQAKGYDTSQNGDKKAKLRTGGKKDKLEKYSNFLEPQNEEEYSAIRIKLLQAGYRSKNAVRTFYFLQFALGILFLLAGVIYAIVQSATGEPTTQAIVL